MSVIPFRRADAPPPEPKPKELVSPTTILVIVAGVLIVAYARRRAAEESEAEKVGELEAKVSAIERTEAAQARPLYDRFDGRLASPWI